MSTFFSVAGALFNSTLPFPLNWVMSAAGMTILSSLSAQERRDFARLLGKIEQSLELVQTSEEADAKEAY